MCNVAVAPQIWLVARGNGRVDGMTGHCMAALALSCACSLAFFWEAWYDITSVPYIEGVNQAIWTIFLAHVAHLLLEFGYYYTRSALRHGLGSAVELRVWHDL